MYPKVITKMGKVGRVGRFARNVGRGFVKGIGFVGDHVGKVVEGAGALVTAAGVVTKNPVIGVAGAALYGLGRGAEYVGNVADAVDDWMGPVGGERYGEPAQIAPGQEEKMQGYYNPSRNFNAYAMRD
jgi:hypothetical protein